MVTGGGDVPTRIPEPGDDQHTQHHMPEPPEIKPPGTIEWE